MPIWISDEDQPPPTPGSLQAVSLPTVRPRAFVTRVSLASSQPLRHPISFPLPKRYQDSQQSSWRKREPTRGKKGWKCCARLPTRGAKTPRLHSFHFVLYSSPLLLILHTPPWLLTVPLLLPSPQPLRLQLPKTSVTDVYRLSRSQAAG